MKTWDISNHSARVYQTTEEVTSKTIWGIAQPLFFVKTKQTILSTSNPLKGGLNLGERMMEVVSWETLLQYFEGGSLIGKKNFCSSLSEPSLVSGSAFFLSSCCAHISRLVCCLDFFFISCGRKMP